jgi:hypothetical protein
MCRALALVALVACGEQQFAAVERPRTPSAAEYPSHDELVLVRELQWDMEIGVNGGARHRQHEQIAVLREGAAGERTLRFRMNDKEEIVFFHAKTISSDGVETKLEPKGHEGKKPDGEAREVVYRLGRVRVGEILDFELETRMPDHIVRSLRERIDDSRPVLRYSAVMRFGEGINYALRVYNDDRLGFRQDADGEFTRLSLVAKDVAPSREPYWTITSPWWGFRAKSLDHSSHVRDADNDWAGALTPLATKIYLDDDRQLPAAKDLVDVKACGTDTRCRIERSVVFVRDTTTFSGFSKTRDWTRPLGEVVTSRRANNYEKAQLLWATLHALGVDAQIALVARESGASCDHTFPSVEWFNHAIVYVPRQAGLADALTIDPSCESCAIGQLPTWSSPREALILSMTLRAASDEPETGAKFMRVSAPSPHSAMSDSDAIARLDATGAIAIEAVETTTGPRAVQFCAQPERAVENLECAEHGARAVWRQHARTAKYASRMAGGMRVPVAVAAPNDFAQKDSRWYYVNEYSVSTSKVRFVLPTGWEAEDLPASLSLKSPAVDLDIDVHTDGAAVVVSRRIVWRPGVWRDDVLKPIRSAAAAVSKKTFFARSREETD